MHRSSEETGKIKNLINEINQHLNKVNKEIKDLTEKITKIPDLEKIKSVSNKLLELEQNKSIIENEILINNKKLENTNGFTITKADLKSVLKNFNEIYDGLSVELKRRLNQLLFVDITSYVKRGSNEDAAILR